MIIGVPKEVKNNEYRVGLTPESSMALCKEGHQVLIQSDAGCSIGSLTLMMRFDLLNTSSASSITLAPELI